MEQPTTEIEMKPVEDHPAEANSSEYSLFVFLMEMMTIGVSPRVPRAVALQWISMTRKTYLFTTPSWNSLSFPVE